MATVEEFAQRLRTALKTQNIQSRTGYVFAFQLDEAIRQALLPPSAPDEQYPRMLFANGDRNQTRIVETHEEEAAALSEGWSRSVPPQYEEGFPTWRVERPPSEGGWKRWDNRRVTLYTSAELRLFEAVVEVDDWIPDGVVNQYGARGVGLDALIAERKQMLKDIVDREVLEPAVASAVEPAMPANDEVHASAEVASLPDEILEESEVSRGN